MRRLLPLLALAALLAGCGGETTVSPTAQTVEGNLATTTQATAAAGDPQAGKALFSSKGCVGCHTFAPAGSHSSTGPDLNKLADYAKQANQGSLQDFTAQSIKDPGAYVQPGFGNIMPSFGLSDKQIADLVAYLTKG